MNILAMVRMEDAALLREMAARDWIIYSPESITLALRRLNLPIQPVERLIDAPLLSVPSAPEYCGRWKKLSSKLQPLYAAVAQNCIGVASGILTLHEKVGLDALVVWTDATPEMRAAILTARQIGIHSFEARHGCWNTYKQGHFECESFVDTVLSHGQEDMDFLHFYGNTNDIVVTGKPLFDHLPAVDVQELRGTIRAKLGIPLERPVVAFATTWRHRFSYWEYEESEEVGLRAVLQAQRELIPTCNPWLIINVHPQHSALVPQYREFCAQYAGGDYSITDASAMFVLPAADVVVAPKSSRVIDALIYGLPAVVFEFRAFNDFGFYKDLGFLQCIKPEELSKIISLALLDEPTRRKLAHDRERGVHYFAGPNDGCAARRGCDIIADRVDRRRERVLERRGAEAQELAAGYSA